MSRSHKFILTICITVLLVPFVFYFSVIGLVIWEESKHSKFHHTVETKFSALKSDTLQIAVCHEWKCTFKYKDPELERRGFLIFGEKNLDQRLALMLYISENFDENVKNVDLFKKVAVFVSYKMHSKKTQNHFGHKSVAFVGPAQKTPTH